MEAPASGVGCSRRVFIVAYVDFSVSNYAPSGYRHGGVALHVKVWSFEGSSWGGVYPFYVPGVLVHGDDASVGPPIYHVVSCSLVVTCPLCPRTGWAT